MIRGPFAPKARHEGQGVAGHSNSYFGPIYPRPGALTRRSYHLHNETTPKPCTRIAPMNRGGDGSSPAETRGARDMGTARQYVSS